MEFASAIARASVLTSPETYLYLYPFMGFARRFGLKPFMDERHFPSGVLGPVLRPP